MCPCTVRLQSLSCCVVSCLQSSASRCLIVLSTGPFKLLAQCEEKIELIRIIDGLCFLPRPPPQAMLPANYCTIMTFGILVAEQV